MGGVIPTKSRLNSDHGRFSHPHSRKEIMKNLSEWVLVGQYGGQKWVIGDYETEREALDVMSSRVALDEKRKGKPGPPLRITVLRFHAVYEAGR